jgi:retron-type reverse transcriptase
VHTNGLGITGKLTIPIPSGARGQLATRLCWVLDADIETAFDCVSHSALMDRVRVRVKDKRVLASVKVFLKAGVLTELGEVRDTLTGTPQGGILPR